MSVLKWLLKGVVGVIVLMIIATIILPRIIDSEALEKQVLNRIEKQTGYSLQIEGPLRWSVFPWIGLETGRVTVENREGFGAEPLAAVDKLDVKVKVTPLFRKLVVVDTVTLKGVRLNLVRDLSGRGNWEVPLSDAKDKTEKAQKEEGPPRSGGPGMSNLVFEMNGLSMQDVAVCFEDRRKDSRIEIQGLALDVGKLVPEKPAPVKVRFGLASTEPDLKLEVDLGTSVQFSGDLQRLELRDSGLDVKIMGDGLPEKGLRYRLGGDLSLDLDRDELAVQRLTLSGPGMNAGGSLNVTGTGPQLRANGRLDLRQVQPREILEQFGVAVELGDPRALSTLSGEVSFTLEGETLTFKPISLQLDDTTVTGDIRVLSLTGPVVRAGISMDDIDLDRYLPAGAGEKDTASSGSAPEEEDLTGKTKDLEPNQQQDVSPSFDALRRLDMKVELRVGRLKVRNLHLQKVVAGLSAAHGVIRMDPLEAALYDGQLSALIFADVRKDVPEIKITKQLSSIHVGPLLRDLSGREQLTGIGDVRVEVRSRGFSEAMITRNMNGKFSFVLRDGAYRGFNLGRAIRRAQAAAAGKTLAADQVKQTDFTELRGTARVISGIVENKDLYMASPVLRITGQGKIDLVRKMIDYQVQAKVVDSLAGQGGRAGDELRGLAVPVRIKGSLDEPAFRVDVEAALKNAAKEQLEKRKSELLEKAAEKVEGRLGRQLLEGFIGQ
ncbi:AsmA family protein [Desulfolithobacter sp.]